MHQKVGLKPRELYGISGSKGHGKDTFARLVTEAKVSQRVARSQSKDSFKTAHFAGALKRMAARIFGLTDAQLHDPVAKETPLTSQVEMDIYLEAMRHETGLTEMQPAGMVAHNPRELMQFFGTEYVRRTRDDYWVQRLIGDVADLRRVLVPDTRFLNEARALKGAGGIIIRVVRIDLPQNVDGHASETEMVKIDPDLLLGVRTGDLTLPKRVANLIASGKFTAAKKYDYRTAQAAIQAYLSGKSLEESCTFLGQHHKDPYVLKNILEYYQIPRRKQVGSRVGHQMQDGVLCKWCGRCKKWVATEQFNAGSKSWDGLAGLCKSCASEDNKERYLKYSKVDSLKAILRTTERSCKYRGKSFSLTLDQLRARWDLQQGRCHFSGIDMTTEVKDQNKITIDRVDSAKGYTPDNVVLCTYRVNMMKRDMSVQEFTEIIRVLHQHLHKPTSEELTEKLAL